MQFIFYRKKIIEFYCTFLTFFAFLIKIFVFLYDQHPILEFEYIKFCKNL